MNVHCLPVRLSISLCVSGFDCGPLSSGLWWGFLGTCQVPLLPDEVPLVLLYLGISCHICFKHDSSHLKIILKIVSISLLVLTAFLWVCSHYFHFIDEGVKAQRGRLAQGHRGWEMASPQSVFLEALSTESLRSRTKSFWGRLFKSSHTKASARSS